jgi:hypothetical protein
LPEIVPGSREWLQARIAEMNQTKDNALAQANAAAGAMSAYQSVLDAMPAPSVEPSVVKTETPNQTGE